MNLPLKKAKLDNICRHDALNLHLGDNETLEQQHFASSSKTSVVSSSSVKLMFYSAGGVGVPAISFLASVTSSGCLIFGMDAVVADTVCGGISKNGFSSKTASRMKSGLPNLLFVSK
ncbi:hypothetical protein Tco_1148605 [Tanacetum coccineum]